MHTPGHATSKRARSRHRNQAGTVLQSGSAVTTGPIPDRRTYIAPLVRRGVEWLRFLCGAGAGGGGGGAGGALGGCGVGAGGWEEGEEGAGEVALEAAFDKSEGHTFEFQSVV